MRLKQIAFGVAAAALMADTALAAGLRDGLNAAQPKDDEGKATTPTTLAGDGGVFKTTADVLIFVTGALAVIVIIVGGLRYVTSTGDAARVKQAKDTIFYGIGGLVVALLAYAIVNFVITQIK